MTALRWVAIVIAAAAVWDPSIRASRPQRPPVDVVVSVAPRLAAVGLQAQQRIDRELTRAGFQVNTGEPPAARVLIADRVPEHIAIDVPAWGIDMSERRVPSVLIRRTAPPLSRLPGQSVEVRVELEGHGAAGETTDVVLEQDGIPLAHARHVWTAPVESWGASLHYVAPTDGSATLQVRASVLRGESAAVDNVADIRMPAARGPVRVLTHDTRVSWPAAFVRRSLEGEPAFALSTVQRASEGIATRAGAPPDVLTASALSAYEVVVIGGPEHLTRREVDAVRSFVEDRGGIAVFIPEQRPSGPYASLLGVATVDERMLQQPVSVAAAGNLALESSELLVVPHLPVAARPLATIGRAAEPVVFERRLGAGAVIFFGALDAWRYRTNGQQSFARFWRRTLSEAALAVPPRVSVEVEPSLARVGEKTRVRARVRETELVAAGGGIASGPVSARILGPSHHIDMALRLWLTVEPGLFEGEWTAPAAGEYDVTISSGDARADAVIVAAAEVTRGADDDPEALALAIRASGGELRPLDRTADVAGAIERRFPPRWIPSRFNPMRSPWWMLPFAVALCTEWAWRRARGGR